MVDEFLETFGKLAKDHGVDAAVELVTAACTQNDIPKVLAAIAEATTKVVAGSLLDGLIVLVCRLLGLGMEGPQRPPYFDAVQAAIRTYKEKVRAVPDCEAVRRSRYAQLDDATHDLRISFETAKRLGNAQDAVRIALLIGLVAIAKDDWVEAKTWLEPLRSAARHSISIFEERASENEKNKAAFLSEVNRALLPTAELLCNDNGAHRLARDFDGLVAYLKHFVPGAKPKDLEHIACAVISEFNVRLRRSQIENAETFLLATKRPETKPLVIDRIPLTFADEISDDFAAGIQA